MDAIQLLLLSIILYVAAALAALLLNRYGHIARMTAGWLGVLASLAGVASAGVALVSAAPPEVGLFQIEPFGWCVLRIDQLSALMIGVIALVSAATSVYSLSTEQGQGAIGFFTHIFVGSMLLVVTVVNGFFFLLFWELMTLASYFLGHLGIREEGIDPDWIHLHARSACRGSFDHGGFLHIVPIKPIALIFACGDRPGFLRE